MRVSMIVSSVVIRRHQCCLLLRSDGSFALSRLKSAALKGEEDIVSTGSLSLNSAIQSRGFLWTISEIDCAIESSPAVENHPRLIQSRLINDSETVRNSEGERLNEINVEDDKKVRIQWEWKELSGDSAFSFVDVKPLTNGHSGRSESSHVVNDCIDNDSMTESVKWFGGKESDYVHKDGLLLRYRSSSHCAMSEITIDMDNSTSMGSSEILSSNSARTRWYGCCHLMRQLWPVDAACLEIGPFYQFDNGPNGVNTLLDPTWVNTNGLMLMAEPNTAYLHVGMNCAHPKGKVMRWAVGVQNFFRELLPLGDIARREELMSSRKLSKRSQNWSFVDWFGATSAPSTRESGSGDGLIHIQARRNYACGHVIHPLHSWRSSAGNVAVIQSDSIDRKEGTKGALDPEIEIALSIHDNVKSASLAALTSFEKPKGDLNLAMIKDPVWTTWARYHWNIDQAKVLKFGKEIVSSGLGRGTIEIDDKWQTNYGDLDFDPLKFPNPKEMVDELHSLGFKVTLWVIPFLEERSEAYVEAKARGFLVRESRTTEEKSTEIILADQSTSIRNMKESHKPKMRLSFTRYMIDYVYRNLEWILYGALKPNFFHWWHPKPVCALDVTNEDAVEWFVSRLKQLQMKYGIDGFKFDAGEPCFLPGKFWTHSRVVNPSQYTQLWVKEVADKFDIAEVRTGHRTQHASVLTRMGDRFSTWDIGNGLRSIIPTLLTSGILGYPFCLPDIVGGNAYFGRKPDAELMIRWTQLNALMPAIQFSITPWDYAQVPLETCKFISTALEIRSQFGMPIIKNLVKDAHKTLEPICRPMWWLDPLDPQTYLIDDQFALGNDVIVAPVVTKGARVRDVYLTQGTWIEFDDHTAEPGDKRIRRIEGGKWLTGVPSPLSKLPCYIRLT